MNIEEFNPARIPNYKDWRLPKNRLEAITRVTDWRYQVGDMDHTHSGLVISDSMGLTKEQKAWYAIIFGHSYRTFQASILMQIFPEIHTANPDFVERWINMKVPDSDRTYGQIGVYGNDTKWNRYQFHRSLRSIQEYIGDASLYEVLGNIATSTDSKEDNRAALDKAIQGWDRYGWMSTWLTGQMLYDFFKWDIDTWELPIPMNWSSHNGVCYIFDKPEYMKTREHNPTADEVSDLRKAFHYMMEYMNDRIPYYVDAYSVESVLCEYRKTAYGPRVKEFSGWTTGELNVLYEKVKENWAHNPKVDLSHSLKGQMTKGPSIRGIGFHKSYFRIVHETGMLQNVDEAYPEMPDVYEHLDIPHPRETVVQSMVDEWNELFTPEQQHEMYERYDPKRRLKGS